MKIHYDMKDNYMKYFNEANGIYLLKKRLKKKPNTKIKSYTRLITMPFIISFILGLICLVLAAIMNLQWLLDILIDLSAILSATYILMLYPFFSSYRNKSINSREGILEIKKDGISDKAKKSFQIIFSYEQIELIVITDRLVVILTETPLMLFFKNKNFEKEKMINMVKKNSNIQVIDQSNN